MKEELRDAGGKLPLLQSEVIPASFDHAFTTRAAAPEGGVFNLAVGWAPEGAERQVLEDRDRLMRALGASRLFLCTQVHGAEVVRVEKESRPEEIAAVRADALITDVPGTALGVFTADCVPLLLADPVSGACASVHAGWRGVVAGVVTAAAREMAASYGSRPADLRVALGPAIGRCCFEVGPEVVAVFETLVPEGARAEVIVEEAGRKPRIDLRRLLRRQLEIAGIPAAQVDEGSECTRCDPTLRFFSFRRDGRAGQQMAVIVRR